MHDYTAIDGGYGIINEALRGGTAAERAALAPRADAISTALSKLPRYEGPVFRGTFLGAEDLARYVPNSTVTEAAFTSTSAAKGGQFPGNTEFLIKSVTGRDVSAVSDLPFESEVLFDKGTSFKVLDKLYDASREKWVIMMKELP
jgi:hypothetical protein